MVNAAYVKFLDYTIGSRAAGLEALTVLAPPRLNVLHLVFDPAALRRVIVNWEQVAKALLDQAQRVALWTRDHAMHELIAALLAYPDVPSQWRMPDLDAPQLLMLPCELANVGASPAAAPNSAACIVLTRSTIQRDVYFDHAYVAGASNGHETHCASCCSRARVSCAQGRH